MPLKGLGFWVEVPFRVLGFFGFGVEVPVGFWVEV